MDLAHKYINKINYQLYYQDFMMLKMVFINENINLLIIGGSQGAKIFDTLIKSSIIKF